MGRMKEQAYDPATGEVIAVQHPASGAMARLEELQARYELAMLNRREKIKEITAHVQDKIDAVEAEHAHLMGIIDAEIDAAKNEVKLLTIAHGESFTGSILSAVYVNGRTTWDDKRLLAYASRNPDVMQFRNTGEPSVTIRAKGGGR